MQLGSHPGSILPQPSENKDRVKNLHNYLGYTKGVDDTYYNMVGYRLYGYTIIRAEVLARGYSYHGDSSSILRGRFFSGRY